MDTPNLNFQMGKLEDYKLKTLDLFKLPDVKKETKDELKKAVQEFQAKIIKIKSDDKKSS